MFLIIIICVLVKNPDTETGCLLLPLNDLDSKGYNKIDDKFSTRGGYAYATICERLEVKMKDQSGR